MKNNKKHITLSIIITIVVIAIASILYAQDHSEIRYQQEQKRFTKVLEQASDDELFIVLKYAIANHFVPNNDLDPYFDMYVMVRPWKRSLMVYEKLKPKKDLLQQIYPDLEVLDDYIKWWHLSGAPYPDTVVSKAILDNVGKDIKQIDSIMGKFGDKNSLINKYFATPLLRY